MTEAAVVNRNDMSIGQCGKQAVGVSTVALCYVAGVAVDFLGWRVVSR